MILLLYQFVTKTLGMQVPSVLVHSSTRMVFAALTALFLILFFGPRFIYKLYTLKTGQSIRVEDCPVLAQLHEKKKETPTMGGLLILFSMLMSLLLWMDLKSSFTLLLFITTVGLGTLGGIDDYLKLKFKNSKGLKAKKKFGFQIVLALFLSLYLFFPQVARAIQVASWFKPPAAKEIVAMQSENEQGIVLKRRIAVLTTQEYMTHYFVPFVKGSILTLKGAGIFFGIVFTLFVITGSSNAVNLTDGLDGLAAGCLVMVAAVLAAVAFLSNNIEMARYLHIFYIEESGEIAIYLFALIGACLGFLWYNGHPAQVFMGDTGSLALGGIIGLCAVLLRKELLLALVGGVFVAEALSVILQVGSYRLRNKKRIFLCAPLHHHFEYKGWPETKVVLRFWMISLILALIGIASLKLQ